MIRRWPLVLLVAATSLGGAIPSGPALAQTPASVTIEAPGGEVTITADDMEQSGPTVLIARGNVEMTRGSARMLADRVEINRDSGDAVALGRVIFYDGDDRMTAERIDYNLKTGTGVIHNGRGRAAPYYRIGGERMDRLDASNYLIKKGVFTTCEDDPPTWSFRFGEASADLDDIIWGTNAS